MQEKTRHQERSLGEDLVYLEAMKSEIARIFNEPWHREGVAVCHKALDRLIKELDK